MSGRIYKRSRVPELNPGVYLVYKHNRYVTGCAAECNDPNCYHGPRGVLYPGYAATVLVKKE